MAQKKSAEAAAHQVSAQVIRDLHERMGSSYATNTFLVIRSALRRETLLALMRLSGVRPLVWASAAFTELFRNLP